jgi:arylsulfatase A-like enzyme
MDFFPTILSLAGVPHSPQDGKSLVSLLTGQGQLDRDELFWHYPHYHGSAWKPGSAIRKGDWKLIYTYEDTVVQLYNLVDDPGEMTDVSETFADRTKELKQALLQRLSESGAKFPTTVSKRNSEP